MILFNMVPPPGSSSVVLLVLVVLSIQLQVKLSGATVTVGASSQWADEGSDTFVTCTPSETIRFLRWYKSATTEEFTDAQEIVRLFVLTGFVAFDPSVNASRYSFDKSASDHPLTINGVGLDDEVSYWCDVELNNGPRENDKTSFQVRRIPASIVLKHGGMSHNDGSEVEVIEGENQFECSVPNIKPAAKFTWRLGSTDLDSFTMWNETINEDPRLVNSYSNLTVIVDADSQLTCSAQNKQNGTSTPDQTISIMLKTRADPCSAAPCLNGGKCSPTADSFQCTCADGFTGDTCGDDTYGQNVTVTMNNAKSDVSTNTATMICEFLINDASYALFNVVWRKGVTTLAHFFGGAADPTYLDYCVTTSPSPCTISRSSSSSQFVLSPVDFNRDNGNDYECQASYIKDTHVVIDSATAALTVVLPTNTIVMSNGSSSEAFTNGGEVDLSLDVASHIFQCEVAGINPQATFTWTVGDELLSSDSITESHNVDSVTGLTTSTSNAALTPNPVYNEKDLICKAVNYEGDPGVMFRLVLKVADPCDSVVCTNGGSCVIDTSDPSDPSKTKCNCAVGYEGELCESSFIFTGLKL